MIKKIVLHRLQQFDQIYSNTSLFVAYRRLTRWNPEKIPLFLACEWPDSIFAKVCRPDQRFNPKSYDLVYNLSKNSIANTKESSCDDRMLCMYFPTEYRHLRWTNNNFVFNVSEENDTFVVNF